MKKADRKKERFRNEWKYLISTSEKEVLNLRMKPLMKLDPHAETGGYLIRSLYFDDYWNSAYEENRPAAGVVQQRPFPAGPRPLRRRYGCLRAYDRTAQRVRRSGRVDSHREGQHSLGAREPVALYFTAQAESLLKRLSYWTVAYACSASSTPAASSLPNPCQMPSAVRNPFRLMAGTASRMASRKR